MTSPDTDGTRDMFGRGSSSMHADEASAKQSLKSGRLAEARDYLDSAYQDRVTENRRNKSANPATDHGAGFVRARRDSVDRHIAAAAPPVPAPAAAPAPATAAPKPGSGGGGGGKPPGGASGSTP